MESENLEVTFCSVARILKRVLRIVVGDLELGFG